MSKDNDASGKRKEEREWLPELLLLVPLFNFAIKVLELLLKYFKRI